MILLRDLIYIWLISWAWPLIAFYLLKTGKYRTDWAGRFGGVGEGQVPDHSDRSHQKTLMIHAVSVGEVNGCRELVRMLLDQHPEIRIVLTVTTNTGTARAKQVFENQIEIYRFPWDFSPFVRAFLNRVKPDAVFLFELELWPNFMAMCKARDIPVAVVNGRLSERSFKSYYKFKAIIGPMFKKLQYAAVQDKDYAARFQAMGVAEVEVTGTMKWDTQKIEDEVEGAAELAALMKIDLSRPLIVCGSTGPGEEVMIRQALADISVSAPSGVENKSGLIQLLFAPRKPERFEEVARELGDVVSLTELRGGQVPEVTEQTCFLLDTIGDLRKAYSLADLAIVGRSFCPLYGSDMVEPISLGVPTIIGPNTKDFIQMVKLFVEGGGLSQVSGVEVLRTEVEALLLTSQGEEMAEAGREVIRQQQGASQRHVELALKMLRIGDP